jgi:hypothetical protein
MSGVIKFYTGMPVGCHRTIITGYWLFNLYQLAMIVVTNYKLGVTPNQLKMFKFVLRQARNAAAKKLKYSEFRDKITVV